MDQNTPCVSFIFIINFEEEAKWVFLTDSVSDLLGYEPRELVGHSAYDVVHPDENEQLRWMHHDTIGRDKAAVLAYFRIRHKDPHKGYILCGVTRTIVYDIIVGSISFATPGPKAMHNASTAQEIVVVTPVARDLEFRRWNDPLPASYSTNINQVDDFNAVLFSQMSHPQSGPLQRPRSYPIPPQSIRVALILDRFTVNCTIDKCTNDLFFPVDAVLGRSFFDYVAEEQEALVRTWIDMVKGWGVNDRGQPSDGGFGFGKFYLYPQGRNSAESNPAGPVSRRRTGSVASRSQTTRSHPSQPASQEQPTQQTAAQAPTLPNGQIQVDAIFSAHSDGVLVVLRRSS